MLTSLLILASIHHLTTYVYSTINLTYVYACNIHTYKTMHLSYKFQPFWNRVWSHRRRSSVVTRLKVRMLKGEVLETLLYGCHGESEQG